MVDKNMGITTGLFWLKNCPPGGVRNMFLASPDECTLTCHLPRIPDLPYNLAC